MRRKNTNTQKEMDGIVEIIRGRSIYLPSHMVSGKLAVNFHIQEMFSTWMGAELHMDILGVGLLCNSCI